MAAVENNEVPYVQRRVVRQPLHRLVDRVLPNVETIVRVVERDEGKNKWVGDVVAVQVLRYRLKVRQRDLHVSVRM